MKHTLSSLHPFTPSLSAMVGGAREPAACGLLTYGKIPAATREGPVFPERCQGGVAQESGEEGRGGRAIRIEVQGPFESYGDRAVLIDLPSRKGK